MVQCVMVSLGNSELEVSWGQLQSLTQFQRNFSIPPTVFEGTPPCRPHWFLLGSVPGPPRTSEEASTLQFPGFQFTLPVETHSKEKGINIKCESGKPAFWLQISPQVVLCAFYLPWPHRRGPHSGLSRTLASPQNRAMWPCAIRWTRPPPQQLSANTFSVDRYVLTEKKPLSGRKAEKGLR